MLPMDITEHDQRGSPTCAAEMCRSRHRESCGSARRPTQRRLPTARRARPSPVGVASSARDPSVNHLSEIDQLTRHDTDSVAVHRFIITANPPNTVGRPPPDGQRADPS